MSVHTKQGSAASDGMGWGGKNANGNEDSELGTVRTDERTQNEKHSSEVNPRKANGRRQRGEIDR